MNQTLGNTGIRVSPICLGTMTFGNPVTRDDAIRLVHHALDSGVNFIDTADMYEGYDRQVGSSGGLAESILGEALIDRRDRAVVTTKVGSDVGRGESLAPDYIARQIDASLRRLRTDYVDVYELHRPDPNTPLADSIEAMARLVEAGKIRCWGFSNFGASQVRQMCALADERGWPRPQVSQPYYNWMRREAEAEHLPVCRELGIAATPYRPLEGGLLTGKYRAGQVAPAGSRAAESGWLEAPDDDLRQELETFEGEASRADLTPTQYALTWLRDRPGVISVVVGVKRQQQLDDAVRACMSPPGEC